MPESRTSEFAFQVPDDWKDRRVIAWSAQPKPGQKVVPNVLATYDRLPADTSIEAFVDNQVSELMRGAKRFALKGVNRRPKGTPYRRAKGTPFVEQRDGYDGRAVRAGCGVGRA